MQLQGAVALVTGASSGIGRATALALAARGTRLILSGRDRKALAVVAAATGGQPIAADLTAPDDAERLAAQALAVHGYVDVLCSSAGAGWAGKLTAMPPVEAERLVRLDLLAPVRLTGALLPGMLDRRRGHLIYVTSIAGVVGVGGETVYAAAKAGLGMFADSLRQEVAGHGVVVTVVIPGAVDTPFFTRRGSPYSRAWPRPVAPERVARGLLDAVVRNRAEVFVPAWLRLPARLHGGLPGLYRALAGRLGG